jgi:ABC-type uncharacterized transport system auxiliary subunit
MKTQSLFMIALVAAILCGCSGSKEQRQAYDAAYQFEQDNAIYAGAMGYFVIKKYQDVIEMDPRSSIAKDAQQRIDAVTKTWNDYEARQQQSIDRLLPH